jgi:hypothetical protein
MKLNKVVDGTAKYIAEKLYPTMVDWQKLIAVDIVTRAIDYSKKNGPALSSNSLIRALGYVDSEENVDIDGVLQRLKEFISDKGGRWKVKLPLMPTFTFTEKDVDDLYEFICDQ